MTDQCESPLRCDIVDFRQTGGGGGNVGVFFNMVVLFQPENLPLAAHVTRVQSTQRRRQASGRGEEEGGREASPYRKIERIGLPI